MEETTLSDLVEKEGEICHFEDSEPVKILEEKLEKIHQLESLGFKKAVGYKKESIQCKLKLHRISEWGYIQFNTQSIEKFLDRLVELYNQKYETKKPNKKTNLPSLPDAHSAWLTLKQLTLRNEIMKNWAIPFSMSTFAPYYTPTSELTDIPPTFSLTVSRKTCHYQGGGEIGQYLWIEDPIENYKALPPKKAIEKLKIAKERNIFDYFTIGHVEKIKDPLLLGRIESSDLRFFIAQWGDDVSLDDVI